MLITENKKTQIIFGTKEWACHNINFISGCEHDCKYCYSKEMAIRFNRKKPDEWKNEELNFNKIYKNYKKYDGRIMFPSSHDISPNHLSNYLVILKKLLLKNNEILIVTKPHITCIKEICSECANYKDYVLFRFTIGSLNSEILKFWEPGAPLFEERFESLKYAYNLGFRTSISCEPMLDTNTEKLVEYLLPYITDSIWIGKANFLLKRLKLNNELNKQTIELAKKLLNDHNTDYIYELYNKFKLNKKIKWKESIKKIIGLDSSAIIGMDI